MPSRTRLTTPTTTGARRKRPRSIAIRSGEASGFDVGDALGEHVAHALRGASPSNRMKRQGNSLP